MFASNPHQVFRQLNNENQVASVKSTGAAHGSVSKTPAASKQRRALGDISNRKQGNLNGGGGVVLAKKTQGLRLQPQRNPLATKTPGLTKKNGVTFLPRPSQTKSAQSVSIFPDLGTNKSTSKRPAQKSSLKNKFVSIANDPVDDIERPAGRLGIEEVDDYSCGSVSLPDIDWEAARKKRHDLRIQWKKEEEALEDSAYNEHIEKAWALDDDEPCAMIGEDVWIERTLSFDDDLDVELSFDAPSYCADISF